jgi:hypothetical protein
VANDEKLLSLFEPDIHVIVRGKAGAEVEFGNLLVLGEQSDGLIIDWELFKEEVPADVRLVRPSVERVESGLQLKLKSLVADRGFDNKINVKWLEERGTFCRAPYCEFNEIIEAIAELDADVISIESSRSEMELLEAFRTFKYPNTLPLV